jgi:hypothetical protein
MKAVDRYANYDDTPREDHVVFLSGIGWEDYERLLDMRGERYEPVASSEVLPGLELDLLTRFIDEPTTSAAIRGFRAALQTPRDAP